MAKSERPPTTLAPGPPHPVGEPAPLRPRVVARRSGWSAGRITALVIGALLALLSAGLLAGGGMAFWADWTQRDAGFVTTGVHEFSTAGSALTTRPTDLGSGGASWLYTPGLLGEVRIRVTPASQGAELFVGIAPTADVDRYLAGVSHTVISDFWSESVRNVGGGSPESIPGTQPFWAVSDAGIGTRTVLWKPVDGSWTVVVMNADGRPAIDVRADLGARIPSLLWIGIGLLVFGAVFALAGTLLIVGAIRRARRVV